MWMLTDRLKRWVRRHTPPIEPNVARSWKLRLSLIYAALGWQLMGLLVYQFFYSNAPKNQGSIDYAKLLGIKEAKVYRYSGFSKVDEYEIKLSDDDIKDYYDTYVAKVKQEKEESMGTTKEENNSKSDDSEVFNSL